MKRKIMLILMSITVLALLPVQAAKAQCECVLTPDANDIARGGTLGFWATVNNDTDQTGTVAFATKVTLPNGSVYPTAGFLFGPVPVYLTPYQSRSGHLSQGIPVHAPLGTYTYHGYVGRPDVGIYHECQFDFEVTESGGGGCTACHMGHGPHHSGDNCSACHSW